MASKNTPPFKNRERSFSKRPASKDNPHRGPAFTEAARGLFKAINEIEILGQNILANMQDTLLRTEISGDDLFSDRLRTKVYHTTMRSLKINRSYRKQQDGLMTTLRQLRPEIPHGKLISFYEIKEKLGKQHLELKAFTQLCESRLQLIRFFNTIGDHYKTMRNQNKTGGMELVDMFNKAWADKMCTDLEFDILDEEPVDNEEIMDLETDKIPDLGLTENDSLDKPE